MFKLKSGGQAKVKTKIGLDMGTDSVKMVEIALADKPRLIKLGIKKNSDGTKSSLADSVKALADEAKISAADVNISVSGSDAIVRFLSMPKMREADLKSAIRFEAEKFIPFDINDCLLDFQILSRDDKENKINILLAAAKKGHVLERIKLVEEAGLSVALVDVDSFALSNSFLKNFSSLDPGKSFALINMGSSVTSLSILRGSSPYFARDMLMGAGDFLAAISKRMGVAAISPGELKAMPADRMQEVIDYAKQALGNFLDEVRLSFSYYENQGGAGIDEIYTSGGACGLIGLAEAFEENFGSRPIAWNPLQFLDTTSPDIDAALIRNMNSSFAVASGLALR